MKKVIIAITIFVMFFAIKVYAAEVEITDIKCDNLYDEILKEDVDVEVNALNLTIDDTYFTKEGDYLKCTLEITNSSNEEVEVSSQAVEELSTENIVYSLKSDGNNIIESGKSKVFTFLAEYKKALAADGEFDNVIEIKIANDTIKVPDTLVKSLVVLLITVTSVVSVVLLFKTRKKAYLALAIGSLFLLMPTAKALVNVTVTVNSKIIVEVSERYKVQYAYELMMTDEEAEEKIRNHNYVSIEKTNFGTEESPAYVNINIGGKEYYIFNVVELDKNYLPGEEVEVKMIKIPNGSNCNVDPDTDIATCESIKDFLINGWDYYGNLSDLNVNETTLVAPLKYTMPNHDIVLEENYGHLFEDELTVTYAYDTYLTEEEAEEYDNPTKSDDTKYVYDGVAYYSYHIEIIEEHHYGDIIEVKDYKSVRLGSCIYNSNEDQYDCSEKNIDNEWKIESEHISEMKFTGNNDYTGGCSINEQTGEEFCSNYISFHTPMSFTIQPENVYIFIPGIEISR